MREIKTSTFVETLVAFASFLIIIGLVFTKIMLSISETYAQVGEIKGLN